MPGTDQGTEHKPICVECVMTWLLRGDGVVCLACQQPVVWKGRR